MKSKTSCFNATIFKKNVTHYWPIWLIYLCYLLIMLPINTWLSAEASSFSSGVSQASKPYLVVVNVLEGGFLPFPIFLFSAVMALAVFSYLYSPRNANMMHALPVNRLELYITNYLSGLLFLIIPEIIAFISAVLVCLANQIICIQYLFIWLVFIAGITFFAYSSAVFVAMFTGQILAMPVYYFIMNYLYVGCLYIISLIIGLVSYGITDSWNPGASCILSPIYYLGNNMRARTVYEDGAAIVTGIKVVGGQLVLIYAAAGVIIMLAAYQLYKRRRIETAGDLISIGIIKPVFRWGVALCGGVLLSVFITSIMNDVRKVNTFLCILGCIVVFSFICFFAAEMLLQKSFRIFRKKRILEWAGVTVAAIVFLSLFKLDAFGIERYLPDADEVNRAFVYMDYPIMMEGEEIQKLLLVNQQIIERKQEYLEATKKENGFYYVTFRYRLKSGKIIERRYPLPMTEEYLKDHTSPASKILEWEKSPELIKEQMLGINYQSNEYYSGYVDLYATGGRTNNYTLDSAQIKALVEAVEKDADEGNFTKYYRNSIAASDTETYFNGISFDYYNKTSTFNSWDYYNNYDLNASKNLSMQEIENRNTSSYISFGPDCVHVVETLKQLGIINETWKLCTYEEYEEYFKK